MYAEAVTIHIMVLVFFFCIFRQVQTLQFKEQMDVVRRQMTFP